MPKIRNKSGQPLFVPSLNLEVGPDEVFDVEASAASGFKSDNWEHVDAKKTAAADK